ncbi:MAG: hypothetical protein E6I61_15855 [Chloroflexi bacterium]|nr:MAG: hypothetical protein E6I61_15855 [Chloroflexota bacterium]
MRRSAYSRPDRPCAYAIQKPFLSVGAYPNYLFQRDPGSRASGLRPAYEPLVPLKNRYDPINFFRLNQNIPPSKS